MLTKKLIDYCKEPGWWYDDASADYALGLERLGVDAASAFGQFCLHVEDGPTFIQRGKELYQVCWFAKNTNYALAMKHCHETLGLPQEYLPLDSFEGGSGYFYNRTTGQVLALSLGRELLDFKEGRLMPQWPNFNDFLVNYFELSA